MAGSLLGRALFCVTEFKRLPPCVSMSARLIGKNNVLAAWVQVLSDQPSPNHYKKSCGDNSKVLATLFRNRRQIQGLVLSPCHNTCA